MSKENVLRVSDITMQFGGVVAVDDLSLEVNKGEIIGLIGPNGAGKTTAFNVITGVYAPTNGAVALNGEVIVENHPQGKMKNLYKSKNDGKYKDVKVLTPDKITKLGVARTFQNIRLYKGMTVFENVLVAMHMNMESGIFGATFRSGKAKREEAQMREDAMNLLRMFDLEKNKDDLATSLPYGKQRHLEIARALATKPKLLLLDEPAAGMNPQESAELMRLVERIRDEFDLSVLMIEHHMQVVMGICERIYVLDYGALIAQGNPEEIQNNPRVIEAYLGVDE
ncbi:MAG: ABC transporter ATP-binding protein [Anaerovoracaceae bacterium]